MLIGAVVGGAAPMAGLVVATAALVLIGAAWKMRTRMTVQPVRVQMVEQAFGTLEQRFGRGELGEEDYRRLRAMTDRAAGRGETGRR